MTKHTSWTASFQCLAKSLLQRLGFTSLCLWPAWEITKGAFHLSELTGQPIPIAMRISLLIKLFSQICQMLNKLNSLSSGHCRDLKLVSSLPRVRNSESLYFQAKRVKFIFACDFAAIYIIEVCVIAGCLLGKKEMIFQQKLFLKVLFHCQSDQSG